MNKTNQKYKISKRNKIKRELNKLQYKIQYLNKQYCSKKVTFNLKQKYKIKQMKIKMITKNNSKHKVIIEVKKVKKN